MKPQPTPSAHCCQKFYLASPPKLQITGNSTFLANSSHTSNTADSPTAHGSCFTTLQITHKLLRPALRPDKVLVKQQNTSTKFIDIKSMPTHAHTKAKPDGLTGLRLLNSLGQRACSRQQNPDSSWLLGNLHNAPAHSLEGKESSLAQRHQVPAHSLAAVYSRARTGCHVRAAQQCWLACPQNLHAGSNAFPQLNKAGQPYGPQLRLLQCCWQPQTAQLASELDKILTSCNKV